MLLDQLKKYRVVLASKSPRRKQLLEDLGIDFSAVQSEDPEFLDPEWAPSEAVCHLAQQKAESVFSRLNAESSDDSLLVIGGDTLVSVDGKVLGKPKDAKDAERMLHLLSGRSHTVWSGLCVRTARDLRVDYAETEVCFLPLSDSEISYYIDHYKPFDKAGSYGVQEWIGYRGISAIRGSYNNVVGLPTSLLWCMLEDMII